MSMLLTEWLGEVPAVDAPLLEEAPGGVLSEAGRQAAVEASLALLGTYFSGGNQEIADRAAIAVSDQDIELDAIHAGLRLRVALAAGRRLTTLLDSITRRPTFRYELHTTEHVGSLSGPLDINRWVTRQGGGDQDVTFPVLEVTRGAHTAENVLASFAALWLIRELKLSLAGSVATQNTVEYGAVRALRERLMHLLQRPVLAACVPAAQAVRTRAATERLLSQVKHRLRRREIFGPGPYRTLVDWIDHCLQGHPAVRAGEVDLSVYGSRFDNKLFELWCLSVLGRGLASALNVPDPLINHAWRRGAPAFTFENFSGRIELFFQQSLSSVDREHLAIWKKESGRRLGGIPDIVARGRPIAGGLRLAVVDPKLRQRDRLPAEELYKILGYLQNFDVRPAVGMVLIYTTRNEAVEPDVFHDGVGGTLISASLNPAAPDSITTLALESVIKTIVKLIDYDIPERITGGKLGALSAEETAEQTITTVQQSLVAWGRGHLSEIGPSRERIRTLVGEARWSALEDDVQTMVATADLVGHQLDPAADFSGPVIGMCAAIEHILYGSVISPIADGNRDWERQTRTFGGAIDVVELACGSRGGELPRSVRRHMDSLRLNIEQVRGLIPIWRRLNTEYRVPAAHRKVLTKSNWQQLYRLVIGSEALFAKTYDMLHAQGEEAL